MFLAPRCGHSVERDRKQVNTNDPGSVVFATGVPSQLDASWFCLQTLYSPAQISLICTYGARLVQTERPYMSAIIAILIFLVVLLALNKMTFGRLD